MVHIRHNRNTLPRLQQHFRPCRHNLFLAVRIHRHIRIQHLTVFCPIIHRNIDIIAPAVNNILHLIPVKMHGSRLPLVQHKKLLRIRLGILLWFLPIPIADRQQRESHLVEIPKPIIRNIPSKTVLPYLVILMPHALPVLRAPFGKGRNLESVFLYQGFHIFNHFINP